MLKTLARILLTFIFSYGIFSFALWDIYPGNWDGTYRAACAFFNGFFAMVWCLAVFDHKSTRNKLLDEVIREDWKKKYEYITAFANGDSVEVKINGEWRPVEQGASFERSATQYRISNKNRD